MNELIAVQKIAGWEKLKALVLDSVSSPITKREYNMALNEFLAWFQQAPRPGFSKATVSAWRVSLEDRRLGSSSIIIRMSAIRKLAAEAADNGLTSRIKKAWVELGRPNVTANICDKIGKVIFAEELEESAPGSVTHKRVRERVRQAILRTPRR